MATDPTASPTLTNWLSIAALGVIWGGTFMVVTVALQGYGPVTVAAARTGLGALALLGMVLALGRPWPRFDGRFLAFVLPIGALSSALPFFLLAWGQQHVSSAYAGLNMAALPLFVLPLAHVFGDERLSLRKSLGFLVGFAGAAVLIAPGLTSGSGSAMEPFARLACLGAVMSYAVSSILTRRCPPVDPVVLSALGLIIGSAILTPPMLMTEGLPGWAGARAGWALLFLGLVPTGLAALLRVLVIRSAGSTFMTLVNYQVPVWSMVFGAAVLGELLPLRFFVALALILLGLAISQFGALRRLFAG
ncbi:MAG: DMT family transporter [Rhodobacter sp.]|nr:DMT family transporter [Rhodobacter sp.]